jgi:hypothetical protein
MFFNVAVCTIHFKLVELKKLQQLVTVFYALSESHLMLGLELAILKNLNSNSPKPIIMG